MLNERQIGFCRFRIWLYNRNSMPTGILRSLWSMDQEFLITGFRFKIFLCWFVEIQKDLVYFSQNDWKYVNLITNSFWHFFLSISPYKTWRVSSRSFVTVVAIQNRCSGCLHKKKIASAYVNVHACTYEFIDKERNEENHEKEPEKKASFAGGRSRLWFHSAEGLSLYVCGSV